MSNLFVNLPLPVLNGPGAAVDTSGMGNPKTITIEGVFPGATIAIEASVDGGAAWAPVAVFQTGDSQVQKLVAANFMRTNVSGRNSALPFSANVDIGAQDAGAQFIVIPLPVGNGPGPAVNVATFGVGSTFIAGGSFAGATIRVEISEDNIAWAPLAMFAGKGGLKNHDVTAQFVRAVVAGRVATVAFTGSLAMGSVNDSITISGVDVQDESVALPNNPHPVLNFVGPGVTATDGGGGVATITIPGGGGGGAAVLAFGNNSIGSPAGTRFLDQWSNTGTAGTAETAPIVAPRSGTLKNMIARHEAAVGNGNTIVYTVRVNGVDTLLTVTLASGAIGQVSNLVNTVAVAQGDRITLKAVKALVIANGSVIPSVTMEFTS